METKKALLAELDREAINTHKMLSRVPMDKREWAPHEKSMTLEKLARHVANLPKWITHIITNDGIDFMKGGMSPLPEVATSEELAGHFDQIVSDAKKAIENASEEELDKTYTMRRGEMVLNAAPKSQILRSMALNHLVHHRGQLSVYLRLLDVPIPGMYGPSADDARPA